MTTGSILLGIALFLLVALFLIRPFVIGQSQPTAVSTPATPPRQQLLIQKESLLNAIHTLDFDHATGKVPTAVYHPQRQQLVENAAIILQQLDQLGSDPAYQQRDAAIEAAIAKLRQTRTSPARFCTQCGQPTAAADKFCAACGHPLG